METRKITALLLSLSVLGGLKKQGVVLKLLDALRGLDQSPEAFMTAYGALVAYTLENGGVTHALTNEILQDENIFAKKCRLGPYADLGPCLKKAAEHDAAALAFAARALTPGELLAEAARRYGQVKDELLSLPPFDAGGEFTLSDAPALYDFYSRNGYGFFAGGYAFVYRQKSIRKIRRPDTVGLSDLKGYEWQKSIILRNTRQFLDGREANNILLYGDKGTGKSSTVKAVMNEYRECGLKLVELKKEDLCDFSDLCELLSDSPFKFIVFLDDISFTKEEDSFSALKAVIEGGVVKRPDNVLIYATSNRRHLVGESFSDRLGSDIHVHDTMETLTSLSDRFGIEIVFSVPDKDEYLKIVEALAREKGLAMTADDLYQRAESFALRKNGRSPRTARQFVTHMLSGGQESNG